MTLMYCKLVAIALAVVTQLEDFGAKCEIALPTTFIKTPSDRISFGRPVFISPVKLQTLIESLPVILMANSGQTLPKKKNPPLSRVLNLGLKRLSSCLTIIAASHGF